MFASKCRLDDLEERLANETAYYAQSQLLAFIKRGYSHNPLVFANALAGIPSIGCRHSFALCSRQKAAGWPSLRYEILRLIQRIWEDRNRDDSKSLAEQFRSAIIEQPLSVNSRDPRGHGPVSRDRRMRENYIRKYLCLNWRYLRLAVARLHLRKLHPKSVPYVIASRLYANLGRPRTFGEQTLAEVEAIKK
jgi:hypothetical protein